MKKILVPAILAANTIGLVFLSYSLGSIRREMSEMVSRPQPEIRSDPALSRIADSLEIIASPPETPGTVQVH